MVVAVVVVHYWAGVAAGRAGEVSPGAGGVHREFRRGVPGRASSQPVAVVEDACRHPLATLLADVRRTLPRRRLHRNGFVINTAAMTGNGFYRAMLCIRGWRRGVVVSGARRMNEVNARRAQLVPGWVTVFGRVYHLGM